MTTKKQFSNFQELIAHGDSPVLVNFYTPSCPYCQMLSPILDQVKAEMGDRIQVVKINAEKYPELASEHMIQALPTTLFFVDRELVSRIKGVLQAPQFIQYLQKFLN
jgi:thioredoxin